MQIVIDIPEDAYNYVINTSFVENTDIFHKQSASDRRNTLRLFDIMDAIKNGIPLPKRHGRLIDADAFHKVVEEIPIKDTDKWFNWMQKTCNRLADAPTIIEADKE